MVVDVNGLADQRSAIRHGGFSVTAKALIRRRYRLLHLQRQLLLQCRIQL